MIIIEAGKDTSACSLLRLVGSQSSRNDCRISLDQPAVVERDKGFLVELVNINDAASGYHFKRRVILYFSEEGLEAHATIGDLLHQAARCVSLFENDHFVAAFDQDFCCRDPTDAASNNDHIHSAVLSPVT